MDRGWIWAIAHVRGGSEKGWGWFLGGRGMQKTHTFSDFIACAEHLTADGYGAKWQDRRLWRVCGRDADGRGGQYAGRTFGPG